MALYTLLYLKWITNKDLLYIAYGTLISVMWQPGWEGSLRDILSISLNSLKQERRAESWAIEMTTWIVYIIFYDRLR